MRAKALTVLAADVSWRQRSTLILEVLEASRGHLAEQTLLSIAHHVDRKTLVPVLDAIQTLVGAQKLRTLLSLLNVVPARSRTAIIEQSLHLAETEDADDRLYVF